MATARWMGPTIRSGLTMPSDTSDEAVRTYMAHHCCDSCTNDLFDALLAERKEWRELVVRSYIHSSASPGARALYAKLMGEPDGG